MTEKLTETEWQRVQNDLREHLDDLLGIYGEDANENKIVEDNDEYVILADGSGREIPEIAEVNGVDRDGLADKMHRVAKRKCDYNWDFVDPVVILKD